MKRNNITLLLSFIFFCFFLPTLLFAQKNYISIEGGRFYGGVESKLNSAMSSTGFGDRISYRLGDIIPFIDIFTDLGSISLNDQYPKNSHNKGISWIRYGRELKNGKFIELSYGKMKSSVEGFDVTSTDNVSNGNRLKYTFGISALTAHYIFSNKVRSLAIGIGPALAFDAITREANTIAEKKNTLQPGISSTASWRFVNGKVFFMALRGDAMLFAPASIEAVTLTSSNQVKSTFNGTKVNSLIGDITVSVGFKF